MAGDGRRLAVKAGLAVFAIAAALSASVLGASAADSPLTMTIHVGYHNAVKAGQWMPVVIDITNSGPNLDGTLEIQTGNPQNGPNGPATGVVIYHMPLSLAAGATKHVQTFVVADQSSGTMTARVVDHRRVVASQDASATNTSGVLMGVLSDRPEALGGLASVRLGGISPGVTRLAGAELPDSGIMLRGFDLIAIDDYATDTLTTSQRAALADYVMNGGALLLGTGGSWHETLAGLPASIVPMQPTGSKTLPATQAFGGVTGLEVATGSLAGGTVWLAEGDQPLLIEKLVGSGIVTMATFDWNQDLVDGWSGTRAILRQVFVRSTYGIGSTPSLGFGKGPWVASTSMKGGSLTSALNNSPALDLPAWWIIGALVLGYVLLVGPINYFVLRAINRRALAWITIPVISIVASGGAYGASVLTKGRSVQATQVSILHLEQGWDRTYQETFTGIITPTRGDYDVAVTGGHVLISPIPNYNYGAPGFNQSLIRVDASNNDIALPGMIAFTPRSYATEGITAAPPLLAEARIAGGNLIGTMQNQSTIRFTDAVIIAGSAYQRLPALAPGASIGFNLTPSSQTNPYAGPPPWTQIYPGNFYGGPQYTGLSTDEQRENQTRSAVLSTLPISGYKGSNSDRGSRPIIVAWTKQPSQDLTVNGSHPRLKALTAVVLTLPAVQIGAGTLPAGVVTARAVDLDGEPQFAGPGVIQLQRGGSVTFAFTPTLGPGLHLRHPSFSSSSPFGKPGFAGPGAPPGAAPPKVKAQVWNWSMSAWSDVAYADNASTSVPDSATNPSTGEIRVKLSSDGFLNSGLLTLAADVN